MVTRKQTGDGDWKSIGAEGTVWRSVWEEGREAWWLQRRQGWLTHTLVLCQRTQPRPWGPGWDFTGGGDRHRGMTVGRQAMQVEALQ